MLLSYKREITVLLLATNVILLILLMGLSAIPRGDKKKDFDQQTENYQITVQQVLGTARGFYDDPERTKVTEERTHLYEREGSEGKPALHLWIKGDLTKADGEALLSMQEFSSTASHPGVLCHDHAVSVTNSGYYYIYTAIRYVGNGTEELDFGRILHSVVMRKESETSESPTVLMRNLQSTPSIRRGREAYTTSSLGGTFFLPDNARIMVTSSIPNNIDRSPYGSYFGLFLV